MSLAERQRQLLKTGEFSDFTLNIDGRSFQVHRNIICPQSIVLHRICSGYFKEAFEGSGGLAEENADVFERVLEFLYLGNYDTGVRKIESLQDDGELSGVVKLHNPDEKSESVLLCKEPHESMIHTEVYLLAKYLQIDQLMQFAIEKFSAVFAKDFEIDAFTEAMSRVFNHGHDGGDGLRAQILKLCIDNSHRVNQYEELTRLLMEHEPVAWKLLLWRDEQHTREENEAVRMREALQSAIENLKQNEVILTENWDCILYLKDKYDKCRNCNKEFGSYVDKRETRALRCKACHCRHWRER